MHKALAPVSSSENNCLQMIQYKRQKKLTPAVVSVQWRMTALQLTHYAGYNGHPCLIGPGHDLKLPALSY